MSNTPIFSLVLAAGKSQRFGSPKQLAQYHGQSLVKRATQMATGITGPNTLLIVGAEWRRVVDECTPFEGFFVRNEHYQTGMGSSIACGVRSVQNTAAAVIIMLADHPLITAEHLLVLQEKWLASNSSIVATEFVDITGPPAIFPAATFVSLLNLKGDTGARAVINEEEANVIRVPFADAAVDIDTPDDLRNLD